MKFRLDEFLNTLVAVVIAGLGVWRHGPAYAVNIAGAIAVFFLAHSWLRPRIPEQARASALGIAWGWLAICDGIVDKLWVTTGLGMLAIVIWLAPAFRAGSAQTDKPGKPAAGKPDAPPRKKNRHKK